MDFYKDMFSQIKNGAQYIATTGDTTIPIQMQHLPDEVIMSLSDLDCSGQSILTTTTATQPTVSFHCVPYFDDNAANEEVVVENVMKTPNGLLLLYKNGKTQFIPNKDILTLDKPKS